MANATQATGGNALDDIITRTGSIAVQLVALVKGTPTSQVPAGTGTTQVTTPRSAAVGGISLNVLLLGAIAVVGIVWLARKA